MNAEVVVARHRTTPRLARRRQTRIAEVAIYLALLSSLCTYSAVVGPDRIDTIPEIVARSTSVVGEEVTVDWARIGAVAAREMRIEQRGVAISVRFADPLWDSASLDAARTGDVISVRGRLARDGRIDADSAHVHRGHALKTLLAVPALLIVTVVLAKEHRRGGEEAA